VLERARVTHEVRGLERVDEWLRPGVERDDPEALRLVGRAELERAERETDPEMLVVHLERAVSAFRRGGHARDAEAATRRLAAAERASSAPTSAPAVRPR
jgi:hypothetical protein